MFKNNDKITLQTTDQYYLAFNGTNLFLTQNPKQDIAIWTVNTDENIGFKLQCEMGGNVYYINGNTLGGILNITTDRSWTGTNWCCSPVPVGVEKSEAQGAILLIALTQNGSFRFANGAGSNKTLDLLEWPQLVQIGSNSTAWYYSIQE
jgi:hypothetical protein